MLSLLSCVIIRVELAMNKFYADRNLVKLHFFIQEMHFKDFLRGLTFNFKSSAFVNRMKLNVFTDPYGKLILCEANRCLRLAEHKF